MAVWQSAEIGNRRMVLAGQDGFSIAFYRNEDDAVCALLSLDDSASYQFDEYRLAVVWVDDGDRHDLMLSKRMAELFEKHDVGASLRFFSDSKTIMGVVWHGNASERLGLVGPLLGGQEMFVQVYTDRYEVVRYRLALDSPNLMREVLRLP